MVALVAVVNLLLNWYGVKKARGGADLVIVLQRLKSE